MSSMNWSGESKKAEKPSKNFTPNIYRKPIVTDERETDTKKEESSSIWKTPKNYMPKESADQVSEKQQDGQMMQGSAIDDLLQKESLLSKIIERYEFDFSEYEKKQKELDELKSKFSEQEKELNKKCKILKSAIQKAEKSVPAGQSEKLEKEIAAFEEKRTEFEESRLKYEKEFEEYTAKMEKLSSLESEYESEFEQYKQKKSELDEKCKFLEEKISAGEELSIELTDSTYPAAIEIIKSNYYSELKELNRKRADIKTLQSELENEESSLNEKRYSVEKIRDNIHSDIADLETKAKELEASRKVYEEKVKSHEEAELAFEKEIKALEERKTEFKAEDEKLRSEHEKNIKIHKDKELALQEKIRKLDGKRAELEADDEKLKLKREENNKLEKSMEDTLAEMEAKRKELEEMIVKTTEEIGVQVTIHRQHLDIKKLNNKLEQQTIYIQSLENSVLELKRSLEEASFNVKKNEVFSQIFQQNMELMGQ